MPFRPILIATSMVLALGLPVHAGEMRLRPNAVLELFTSQGCSSCPEADAALTELGKRPDIVALAYHVDYWDYIGWQDTFGTTENSDHQRAYARNWGSASVFTPQLIVNGTSGVVGSRPEKVEAALEGAKLPLPVNLLRSGDMLEISIEGQPGLAESVVWLVSFRDHADVAITRGENAGRTMRYSQIVTGRQVLGMWDPVGGTHLKLPLADVLTGISNGAAILVQGETNGLPGAILGAAAFLR